MRQLGCLIVGLKGGSQFMCTGVGVIVTLGSWGAVAVCMDAVLIFCAHE